MTRSTVSVESVCVSVTHAVRTDCLTVRRLD
jgi:hypothetical protein